MAGLILVKMKLQVIFKIAQKISDGSEKENLQDKNNTAQIL